MALAAAVTQGTKVLDHHDLIPVASPTLSNLRLSRRWEKRSIRIHEGKSALHVATPGTRATGRSAVSTAVEFPNLSVEAAVCGPDRLQSAWCQRKVRV
ncbi:uncharacterized protein BKA78DRAFT_10818 [Phyllosticta capitalensis]|uniref:uncharacterized protein n=1 Tax=Phyllosticta capitalensis TaxID=121624 RepID=UPI0031319406